MNTIMMRIAAILLPLSLLAALPAAAQVIIKGPTDNQDWMILAVMATGPEAEKAKFEAAAAAKGYKPGRSKNNKDEDEVMIVILPNANRAEFLKFYSEARAGKYGNLIFDIAITPWAAVKEKRDFIDEARVYPADAVTVPAE